MEHIFFRAPSLPLNLAYSLQDFKSYKNFMAGLFLASPDLFFEYQRERLNDEKIELSVSKYWIRNCTRCTPFATFAGCGVIKIVNENKSNLVLGNPDSFIKRVRVDMNCLSLITDELLKIPNIKNSIKFEINNSIYKAGNQYRYIEYTNTDVGKKYYLSSIRSDYLIDSILNASSHGITIADLSKYLKDTTNLPTQEIRNFVDELIDSQILISELEPPVTGADPFLTLLSKLKGINCGEDITVYLAQIQKNLKKSYVSYDQYEFIQNAIGCLSSSLKNLKNKLQVDLFFSSDNYQIEKSLVEEISNQINKLKKLFRTNYNAELDNFKNIFYKKYENETIPLLVALDSDIGIGYAGVYEDSAGKSLFIHDLHITTKEAELIQIDTVRKFAINKYIEFTKAHDTVIEITDDDIETLRTNYEDVNFAESYYALGSLFKTSENLNKNNFRFDLKAVGGPSSVNLLGRFAYGDQNIQNAIKKIISKEETEDNESIYFEIAHLPQSRVGNILFRPIIREYELAYVGKSGVTAEKLIDVKDLHLRIVDGNLILFSKSLNKRVVPRLTTAHNFTTNALPVYKFLCDLQNDGLSYPAMWDWGMLEEQFFLPRVVYKNIILSKARWRISNVLLANPSTFDAFSVNLKKLIVRYNIPQRTIYKNGDNDLLIDFNETIGLKILYKLFVKNRTFILEEFLFAQNNSFVIDETGRAYANEIIIPFSNELNKYNRKVSNVELTISKTAIDKFQPLDKWSYFKIYAGNMHIESLLKHKLNGFINDGLKNSLFNRFFFVRYKDDFSHLRVRFHCENLDNQKVLLDELHKLLDEDFKSGAIDKIVIDTYKRELNRYGDSNIDLVEEIFCHDSEWNLYLISLLSEIEDPEKYRMLFALRSIDTLLNDFQLSLRQKEDLLAQMQSSSFNEFGGSIYLQKQLNEKYRAYKTDIFSHMNTVNDDVNMIQDVISELSVRSNNIRLSISNAYPNENNVIKFIYKLLPSIIHMSMNRLFIAQQRKHELVIYHFLKKYYTSQVSIMRKGHNE